MKRSDTLEKQVAEYCRWMETRNYAEETIRNGKLYIGRFIEWLKEREITQAQDVNRTMLEKYQQVLYQYRKENQQPLSVAGQHVRLTTIQGFFKWLCRQNYIHANPTAGLELPRIEKRIPRAILSAREAEQILSQTDLLISHWHRLHFRL